MPKFQPSEGDWICPKNGCQNVNFARRDKCNKCGTSKSSGSEFRKSGGEIGKSLAEKSKGLFSADDWICKSCGNVNWARRLQCNVCNAKKFQDDSRTGYGGGFMERDEVVEYKASRDESDDEYDLYGRKKRKYRLSGSAGVSSNQKGEHEDDDDEEDDDADLSKYNFDAEEPKKDEADGKKPVRKEPTGRDRSRSPSSSSSTSSNSSSSSSGSSSSSDDDESLRSSSRHESRSPSRSPSRSQSRSASRSRSRSRSRRFRRGRSKSPSQ